MPSFRSAILLVTAAFAAFTSAAPLGSIPAAGDVVNTVNGVVPAQAVPQILPPTIQPDLDTRDDGDYCEDIHVRAEECTTCDTLAGVFTFIQAEVDDLTEKCQDTIAEGPITLDVALDLIGEVKALVVTLTGLVQALLKLNLDLNALLTLNGVVLSVQACVALIVKVVVDILACLDVVVKACISVKLDLTAVLSLVAEVVALVVALLKLILSISADLSGVLCAALTIALKVIASIDIKAVLSILA